MCDVSIVVANCKELKAKISFHYMQIVRGERRRLKGQIKSLAHMYKFTPHRNVHCNLLFILERHSRLTLLQ